MRPVLTIFSNGRAIMGVGISPSSNFHFQKFEVPLVGRVARISARNRSSLIPRCGAREKVDRGGRFYTICTTSGSVFTRRCRIRCRSGWVSAIQTQSAWSAALADGWMGAGGSTTDDFRKAVPLLREALPEKAGRDPGKFPISEQRIFISVDRQGGNRQGPELHRWYTEVYHNPPGTGLHPASMAPRSRCANGWTKSSVWAPDHFAAEPGFPPRRTA